MKKVISHSTLRKTILLCSIGGMLELFDFMIFIFFIDVFKTVFFPHASHFLASLQTLSIFMVGYFARPFGGILFGHFADRKGRKKPFSWTLFLMGLPALGMALLPSYGEIGVYSPLLFLALRILQGFSLGGEFPTAVTIMTENTTEKERGFATAVLSASACIGVLLGSLSALLMHQFFSMQQLIGWAWRIPFLFGALIAFLGVYLRRSQVVLQLPTVKNNRLPIYIVIRDHFKKVLRAITVGSVISFSSFCFLFWPHFLNTYFHYSVKETLMLNAMGLVLLIVFTLFFGWMSFYVNRVTIYRFAGLLLVMLSYPLLLLWKTHVLWELLFSYTMFAFLFGAMNAVYSGFIAELFPSDICCSGTALSYNMTTALVCGTLPLVVTYFCQFDHPITVMLFGLITVGLLAASYTNQNKFL